MAERVYLALALLAALALTAAGQEPACASAKLRRSRDFQGGAINQNSSLELTPPPNQAVLPPNYCEFWRVQPEQIQATTCYPESPSAGLSYLLVEMWLGASWNTTGTSPQWDLVNLGVYRMSNMDDNTWAKRKAYSYGYSRYLDKINGIAYHRVVVSTYQVPGAAIRDNTTISNGFQLDPWYLSVNNGDSSRSSSGYTIKVSCVDPNTMPCPSSGPDTAECTSRGVCQSNSTTGKAPSNQCSCGGGSDGYACQISTASTSTDNSYGSMPGDSDLMLIGVGSTPSDTSGGKKKKGFNKLILLVLLVIPAAIIGLWVWGKVAARRRRNQQVYDAEVAKAEEAQPTKPFQPLYM